MEVAVSERYRLSFPLSATSPVFPHEPTLFVRPRPTRTLSIPLSRSCRLVEVPRSEPLSFISANPLSLFQPRGGGGWNENREGRREWSSPRKRNTTSPAAIAGSPFNGSFVVAGVGGLTALCDESSPFDPERPGSDVGGGGGVERGTARRNLDRDTCICH